MLRLFATLFVVVASVECSRLPHLSSGNIHHHNHNHSEMDHSSNEVDVIEPFSVSNFESATANNVIDFNEITTTQPVIVEETDYTSENFEASTPRARVNEIPDDKNSLANQDKGWSLTNNPDGGTRNTKL